jgi:hypothetical protein
MTRERTLALAALVAALAGCASTPPTRVTGTHHGLTLTADISGTSDSIVVDAWLRNDRDEAVYVVPDQCGRVVDVELERTHLEPEGIRWDGPLQAAKELVLDDQRSDQGPDAFHPRRVGQTSSDVPECVRPERVTRLDPGVEIAERWELPFEWQRGPSRALAELGSDGTRIGLEAVEARDPDRLEFLDILRAVDEDADRAGRLVRAEIPTSTVLTREPIDPPRGPSLGELYDRLVADEGLRGWIEAQPVEGWRLAELRPAIPEAGEGYADLRLRLLNTTYERAARVVARPDGSAPVVTLPGEQSRSRVFEHRPGTLPPGIALIPEPDSYTISDDLLVGEVSLPSGRVVVGESLLDVEPLPITVAPGDYPVHATLARYQDQDWDRVSFATLVLSDAPTDHWEHAVDIAVDGGSTSIVSTEGRAVLNGAFQRDQDGWMSWWEDAVESQVAHDYLVTMLEPSAGLELAYFSSGAGDGGYPVYVGYDADGRPTRVVVDFYLLHLAWPDAEVRG